MAADPRYDILFEPIQARPEDHEEPLLPGPSLQRIRLREADEPGVLPRDEGRGRLRRRLHGVLLDLAGVGRHAPRLGAPLGRRRHQEPLGHVRHAPRVRLPLAACELWYAGPHAPCMETRCVPRGPSQIPSDFEHLTYCIEMDKDDIRDVQQMYVDAAKRARTAGFDIVYVYGSHSYLPQQFLTPFYNKRTDEYGGSFENRARFWRETIEKVKEAVGDDTAIAVRLSLRHVPRRGRHAARARRVPVRADGATTSSTCGTSTSPGIAEWGEDATPSRFYAHGPRRPVAEADQGGHDEAGARRRPLDEPGRDGRGDQRRRARHHRHLPPLDRPTRSCRRRSRRAGSTTSASASAATSASRAGRSAARRSSARRTRRAGEEYRRGWHPEKSRAREERRQRRARDRRRPGRAWKRAMILGKRGMRRVHLVEAQDDMGGIMRWIPQLPGLGEWGRVVNYRKIQIDKLKNVEFIPNDHARREGRRRVRRRDRRRRDRLLLGDERPQRLHARHDPRRGRVEAVHPDPGPAHGRGQGGCPATGPGRRQRRLLHGRLDRREATRSRARR